METNRLYQFQILVETGNMTQSAEILNISLSGLSKSIQLLEDELGMQLTLPEGRGLTITDEGLEIYKKSKPILKSISELTRQTSNDSDTLRIGALEVFSHEFLARVLNTHFTDSKIEIADLSSGQIESALLRKQIDIGLTYFPRPQDGLDYLKIKDIKLGVYVCKSQADLKLDQNTKFVLPLTLESPDFTDPYDQDGWPEMKVARQGILRTNRLSTAINFVLNSPSAIFIPEFFARHINQSLAKDKQLLELPLPRGFKKTTRSIFIVKRKSSIESLVMKKLATSIRKEC